MSAGSSNQFVYGLGTTQVIVGTGNTGIPVIPPAHTLGVMFKYLSGGSLWITNQLAQVGASGYLMSTADYSIDGPAQFFLNATGATSIACIAWKYSAGWSLTP